MEALATLRTNVTVLIVGAGYHCEANLAALAARNVTALIADPDMRKRDERIGTVEPVFGNMRYNKRLDRFTLRGRTKFNGQWLLF